MKNIIILNNRNLHLYDFKDLKSNNNLRISAVVFGGAHGNLSDNAKEYLDELYILPDPITSEQDFPPFPKEPLISIIEKDLSKFSNTWLVASDELNILTAAFLREKYNLPGTSYLTSLNYRDKLIQKKVVHKGGIQTPKFIGLDKKCIKADGNITYKELVITLKSPFIIKPTEMFGTIGVEKINSYQQFHNYLSKFSNFSNFIAEEFIEGQLYHCDFIIKDNQYIFSEVSEYLHNGLSFVSGYNHGSLLLTSTHPLRLPIIKFCERANSILGLKSGCGHFEVFVTKQQELIFLEAAARPAGSIVPVVFTKTFKKNYMNAAFLAEVEENPGNFKEPSEYYFWLFFPKKPGIVKSFRPIPIKSFHNIEWLTHIGDVVHKPLSISEKSGFLLANNKNYETLRSDFYSLKNFDAIEVEKI
jgi:hypothetical protein